MPGGDAYAGAAAWVRLLAVGDLAAQLARCLSGQSRAQSRPDLRLLECDVLPGGHDGLAEQLLELRIALAELYRYSCELVIEIAAGASEISAKRPSGVWRGLARLSTGTPGSCRRDETCE
jgi:hypothetical protein